MNSEIYETQFDNSIYHLTSQTNEKVTILDITELRIAPTVCIYSVHHNHSTVVAVGAVPIYGSILSSYCHVIE
jgi:hypothetical protein